MVVFGVLCVVGMFYFLFKVWDLGGFCVGGLLWWVGLWVVFVGWLVVSLGGFGGFVWVGGLIVVLGWLLV